MVQERMSFRRFLSLYQRIRTVSYTHLDVYKRQVKTWDDYEALGTEYVEAAGEKGTKYWTSVDTGGTDWLWLAMAEYGEDWTGGFDGKANVQLDSVKKMLTMQQKWLKSDLAEVSPDGHVDLEAGFQNIMDHNIVSFPKAMWYMSRFTNYMPDEKGNWYIAKCPTFEEGQKMCIRDRLYSVNIRRNRVPEITTDVRAGI